METEQKSIIKKDNHISIKSIVFAGIVIVTAIGWWLSLSYFFQAKSVSTTNLLILLVVFIIFVALLSIFYFLINNLLFIITTSLVGILLSLLFFGINWIYLLALLLSLIGWLVAARKIQREKESRIKINLTRSLSRGIPLILIGLFLMVTVTYYFYSPLLKEEAEIKLVSPKMITTVVLPLIQNKVLSDNIPILKPLTDNSKMLTQKITAVQARDLSQQMGVEFKKNETMFDGLSRWLNQQINQFIGPYREYISIGLAVALFLFLMGLLILFRWLIVLIAWIIWKLLIIIHLVKIVTTDHPVEVVNF